MSAKANTTAQLEPERYELSSGPAYIFDLDRRTFFKLLGSGLLIASVLNPVACSQESGTGRRRSESLPQEINAWLHVGESGTITVCTGKVEVGQNIRTSLTQAVSEELRVPIDEIELVMGDTQLTPYDMGTLGSRTTPTMNLQLRKVSAAARDLLIALAAKQWQVDPRKLIAEQGRVTDPQNKRSVD